MRRKQVKYSALEIKMAQFLVTIFVGPNFKGHPFVYKHWRILSPLRGGTPSNSQRPS